MTKEFFEAKHYKSVPASTSIREAYLVPRPDPLWCDVEYGDFPMNIWRIGNFDPLIWAYSQRTKTFYVVGK